MYLIVTVMWHEVTKILTLFQRDRNWDMRTTKNLILTTPVPVDFKHQKPVFLCNHFHNGTASVEIVYIIYIAIKIRGCVLRCRCCFDCCGT